eukprot:TRINITY_DN66620_c8_g1_i1.p1 TRINITY_DN66620_c8_g1~~TRINITY_DN66620_c8_g1_i1.p1  ORF type:complete len:780 (-),score=349.19 TRINITY_DN66620_c8_g1_i1:59-2359(-)
MPVIRGLEGWLNRLGVVKQASLQHTLGGCRLGVDAVRFFKQHRVADQPLHDAVGGPFAVRFEPKSQAAADGAGDGWSSVGASGSAQKNKNKNKNKKGADGGDVVARLAAVCEPVFVFGGVMPPAEDDASSATASAAVANDDDAVRVALSAAMSSNSTSHKFFVKRHEAWQAVEAGKMRTAAYLFDQVGGYVSLELQAAIMRALRHAGYNHMRAPFAASAQLSWLASPEVGFVHAVYGGFELLLSGVERVVIDIDMSSDTCRVVTLTDVLQALQLTFSQFVETCLIAGFGRCRTFPPVLDARKRFYFSNCVDLVKKYGGGSAAILAFANHPEVQQMQYNKMFRTARDGIVALEALQSGGAVSPFHPMFQPQFKHGHRPLNGTMSRFNIPKAVHALVCKGIVSPQLLTNLLNGVLIDSPPLIPTELHPKFLDVLVDIRRATFATLTRALPKLPKWAHRVLNKRWYGAEFTTELTAAADESKATADEAVRQFAMSLARPGNGPADKIIQACMAHVVQHTALVAQGELTALGRAVFEARPDSHEDFESLIVGALLMRSGLLDNQALPLLHPSGRTIYAPTDLSAENERHLRLITRVCSLVSLPRVQGRSPSWSGPVHRELAAFDGFVKGLRVALNHLGEAALIERVAASHSQQEQPKEQRELFAALQDASLPFAGCPGTAGGLLMRQHLIDSSQVPGASVERLQSMLPDIADVGAQLTRLDSFWRAMLSVVHVAFEGDKAVTSMFDDADSFLRSLSSSSSTTTTTTTTTT